MGEAMSSWRYHSAVTQSRQQFWLSCMQQSHWDMAIYLFCIKAWKEQLLQPLQFEEKSCQSVQVFAEYDCATLACWVLYWGLWCTSAADRTLWFDQVASPFLRTPSKSCWPCHCITASFEAVQMIKWESSMWSSWLLLRATSVYEPHLPRGTSKPRWHCRVTTWDRDTWSNEMKQELIPGLCCRALLNVVFRAWSTPEMSCCHSKRPWAAIKSLAPALYRSPSQSHSRQSCSTDCVILGNKSEAVFFAVALCLNITWLCGQIIFQLQMSFKMLATMVHW